MKQKLALPGRSGRRDSAGVRMPPGREQRTCQPRGNWNLLEIAEGGVALHIVLLLDSFKFRGVDVHPGQYLGARDSKHVYHLPKLLPLCPMSPFLYSLGILPPFPCPVGSIQVAIKFSGRRGNLPPNFLPCSGMATVWPPLGTVCSSGPSASQVVSLSYRGQS